MSFIEDNLSPFLAFKSTSSFGKKYLSSASLFLNLLDSDNTVFAFTGGLGDWEILECFWFILFISSWTNSFLGMLSFGLGLLQKYAFTVPPKLK